MGRKLLFGVVLVAVGVVALAGMGCGAGLVVQDRAVPSISPISSLLAAKLRTPATRAMMFNSLMAEITGKATITAKAAERGIGADKLNNLAYQALPADPNLHVSPFADAAYSTLNWNAGLTFTSFKVPTYGNYHAGDVVVSQAQVSSCIDVAHIVTPLPQIVAGYSTGWGIYTVADLSLELPMEPASYMVAVKLTDTAGNCPASWLAGDAKSVPVPIPPAIGTQFFCTGTNPTVDGKLTAPLLDGSGYVGTFTLEPTAWSNIVPPTMRRCNARFKVILTKRFSTPSALDDLVFGGITVTRL